MNAVALRRAHSADCERVWAFNFAPDVRAVSGTAEPVSPAQHAAWFAQRLSEVDAPIWIIESEGEAVGVVRIDRIRGPSRFGRISIALDRAARGRGIGLARVNASSAPWAAVVLGPELSWISRHRVGLWVAVDAMVHVVRPRWIVRDLGIGARTGPVGVRVVVGPSVRL